MFHTSSNNGWKKIYLDIAGCDDLSSGHPKVKKKLVQFQQQRIWHGFKLIEEPTDNTLFAKEFWAWPFFFFFIFWFAVYFKDYHVYFLKDLWASLQCFFFWFPFGVEPPRIQPLNAAAEVISAALNIALSMRVSGIPWIEKERSNL